ncbi:acyl-CoA dehydrogenase family protein [Hydrocarboniphaga sp.]|uniref:acyl-CoA dehydrogenase family protein n=1 Tax=Hydrocarboniphaga sp. TaxID=2033016 RepID=UPI003D0B2A5F
MTAPIRHADQLFNDVFLPDETRRIRREVRQFADDVVRPVAHRLNTTPESRQSFPHPLFKAMGAAGLYKIPFGADVGGLGLEFPTLATVTVLEELGYHSPSLASALFDGQAILVGQTLEHAGPLLREKYLPKLVRGEFVGSFATSEPEASTDLSPGNMQTIAEKVEGGFRISGTKRWITNSVAADYIAVLCKTGQRQTFLFADMRAPGISVSDPDRKMGNYVQLTADVNFDRVFVADDHVIGNENAGLRAALGALMLGRMGIGAIGVAMAQAAFDFSSGYISRRKVFGKPVAAFQHWQFRYADYAMRIEMARSLYQKAALLYDKTGNAETEAAMAKVAGSELAVDMARDAIQACGAYGFVQTLSATGETFPLESIYRDAKIGEIYEGANEVQRWVIARHIFGRDITG